MFYTLTALIAAGLVAALVCVVETGTDSLLLLLGPLVAASILIYFRLLGRLAWRMTTKDR